MAQKMKNKIQKLVSTIFLMAGCSFASYLFAAEPEPLPLFVNGVAVPSKPLDKKLPNFLPKDYAWIGTLRGEWGFRSVTAQVEAGLNASAQDLINVRKHVDLDANLSFLLLGDKGIPLQIALDSSATNWERVYQAPFRLKMSASYNPQNEKGFDAVAEKRFVCSNGDVKLWFSNGEFLTLKKIDNCDEKRHYYDWKIGGYDTHDTVYEVAKTGGKYKPDAEYKIAELLFKSVPVALTQGKKVILLQVKDTQAINEMRQFIEAPEQVERIHLRYDYCLRQYKDEALATR